MTTGIEVWAGIECSYNRVGDRYFDQLERSRLYERANVVEHLASLGVTAVRFPVLWERVAALGERAWEWTDARLDELRCRGITPIVGLLHHGSGPPGTGLTDAAFPDQFAAFAHAVAERYPWIDRYTPINEPLTTARFALLYGHWHPHETSPPAFARAMLLQCRAIGDAMRAIRDVNPDAQLVQTEDLGKTYATAGLEYQAAFENERRWMTFDLLAGRIVGLHPMAAYLRWLGLSDRELESLAERACPPDVIGVNHYLTSERFLDHRLQRYPPHTWGGNDRDRYADVEAVRVLRDGVAGPYELLRETWERYHWPIAVTEVQLACTREQQLRWLDEVWSAAVRLHGEGGDVRAVTAWSAFGAHDWSSLLTRNDNHYEPGVFDLRAPEPRPTALATMVRSLATRGEFDHPTLRAPGWWRSTERLAYPPVNGTGRVGWAARGASTLRRAKFDGARNVRHRDGASPVLIVGAQGTLGRAMARACAARGLAAIPLSRQELDATDERAVEHVIAAMRPWCVVNCAGFVRVDDAECQQAACRVANVEGARALARACAAFGAKLMTFSTDLVFDGAKRSPYIESDTTRPLSEYGRTKAAAEAAVMAEASDALVVRTAAFFGDQDDHNFVTQVLRALLSGQEVKAASDVVVSPTYVPDLADASLDLAIDGERGVWHLASAGELTWEELARRAARVAEISPGRLLGVTVRELDLAAERPRYSALTSERASIMASVDDALARYARSRPWERASCSVGANGSENGHHRAGPSSVSLASTGARGSKRFEGMAGTGDGS